MSKKHFVELCAHCEGIDLESEEIYEKESSVCPRCQGNSWIVLEVDEDDLTDSAAR